MALVSALWTALYLVWTAFHWGGAENVSLIGNLAPLPPNFVMVIAAWWVVRTAPLTDVRRAWLWLTLGFVSFLVGNLIRTYYENGLNIAPFPSLADAAYLSFYPLVLTGLWRLPGRPQTAHARQAMFLELGMTGVTAFMAVSLFIISPTMMSYTGPDDPVALAVSSAYPIGDLMLMMGIMASLYRRPDRDTRAALFLLLAGMVFFVAADLAFAYFSLAGTYAVGSWVDAGWVIAQFLFMLAALRQNYHSPAAAESRWMGLIDRIVPLISWIALAASVGMLAYGIALGDGIDQWLLTGTLSVAVLAVVRFLVLHRKSTPAGAATRPEPAVVNVKRIAWLALIAYAVVLTLYGVMAWQSRSWALYVLTGLTAALTVSSGAAVWLSRRGRIAAAVWLLLLGLVLYPPQPLFVSGLGLVLGGTSAFAAAMIASLTLKGRRAVMVIALGIASGVLTLLIDLFWPFDRLRLEWLQTYVPLISVLALLVIAVFVVQQFPSYSLRAKLIIAFVVVTIAPMAILAYLNDRFSRVRIAEGANQSLLAEAAQTAASLETFFQTNLDAVATEAQLPVFAEYLGLTPAERAGSAAESDAVATLAALSRKDAVQVFSYALLDRQGVTALDTFTRDIGLDRSGRDYFQEPLRTGRPFVSPVRLSGSDFEQSLYFSAPVRDAAGAILGVLQARYRAANLQQTLVDNVARLSHAGVILLLDENNILLAHSAAPQLAFRSIAPLSAEQAAQLKAEGRLADRALDELVVDWPTVVQGLAQIGTQPTFTADLDSEPGANGDPQTSRDKLVAAQRLGIQPWVLLVAVAGDELLAPLEVQSRNALLLGLVMAGLAVLAAVFVAQVLTSPLVRLTAAAARASAGDLTAQAPVETGDEIGALAMTFNVMTTQLRETLDGLDRRVAERTRALEASAAVSRRLSTVLDQQTLAREVVEQVQAAFGYYHAQIYFWDEARRHLVMTAGTGDAGRVMLLRGHRLPAGKGLVGRAADTNRAQLVPDTARSPDWLPNPLLPETRAEIAVPIALGDRVLGVLDVQHNVVNGLGPEDADLLQALANQAAVAARNAQYVAETQRRAEREAQLNAISQKIQASASVEEALQITARELGRAVGGARTRVRLAAEASLESRP